MMCSSPCLQEAFRSRSMIYSMTPFIICLQPAFPAMLSAISSLHSICLKLFSIPWALFLHMCFCTCCFFLLLMYFPVRWWLTGFSLKTSWNVTSSLTEPLYPLSRPCYSQLGEWLHNCRHYRILIFVPPEHYFKYRRCLTNVHWMNNSWRSYSLLYQLALAAQQTTTVLAWLVV